MTHSSKVNDFLADIQVSNVDQYQTLLAARQRFLSANKSLDESIKYGGLVYSLDGELIGGIFVYKQHLSIEFSHGAQFDDPYTVLEGGGKYRRHIKLAELSDIELKHVGFYIGQACARSEGRG